GIEKSGGDNLSLTPSCKDGRIDSLQNFMGYEHAYLGNLGMPGDSGGAVISHQDGRIIGVLQGGTKSGENGKYEQTFFIPIKYVWEKFVKNSVSNSSLSFASIDALEQMQIKIAEELKRRQNNDIQG
ncbi:MAG: hypothetical protein II342_00550, partial [Clostridia bacterium]|nr:hypothetical protein [Clostridia bacterium]